MKELPSVNKRVVRILLECIPVNNTDRGESYKLLSGVIKPVFTMLDNDTSVV